MASSINDLQAAVVAYMGRNAGDFVYNNANMFMRAVNNAKNYCQRAVDFEMARVTAQVAGVNPVTGGSLTNATLYGTSTAVALKSVQRVYLGTTAKQTPIDIVTRERYAERLQRYYAGADMSERETDDGSSLIIDFMYVPVGQNFYIHPGSRVNGGSTFTVYLDTVEWLSDFATAKAGQASSTVVNKLVDSSTDFVVAGVKIGDVVSNTTDGTSALVTAVTATQLGLAADIFTIGEAYSVAAGVQTSFLLDYCFDYLQIRTMHELNFFLKEDQRVPISKDLLADVWNNVVQWNATFVGSQVKDVTLD